jgi:hypothetical protein
VALSFIPSSPDRFGFASEFALVGLGFVLFSDPFVEDHSGRRGTSPVGVAVRAADAYVVSGRVSFSSAGAAEWWERLRYVVVVVDGVGMVAARAADEGCEHANSSPVMVLPASQSDRCGVYGGKHRS